VSLTRNATHSVALSVHHAWGLATTYYRTSVAAYAVADELMAAGWVASIAVLP
jgi:hypothetical protein